MHSFASGCWPTVDNVVLNRIIQNKSMKYTSKWLSCKTAAEQQHGQSSSIFEISSKWASLIVEDNRGRDRSKKTIVGWFWGFLGLLPYKNAGERRIKETNPRKSHISRRIEWYCPPFSPHKQSKIDVKYQISNVAGLDSVQSSFSSNFHRLSTARRPKKLCNRGYIIVFLHTKIVKKCRKAIFHQRAYQRHEVSIHVTWINLLVVLLPPERWPSWWWSSDGNKWREMSTGSQRLVSILFCVLT